MAPVSDALMRRPQARLRTGSEVEPTSSLAYSDWANRTLHQFSPAMMRYCYYYSCGSPLIAPHSTLYDSLPSIRLLPHYHILLEKRYSLARSLRAQRANRQRHQL
ncbi:hypothetical protein EMPG_14615 [Blastomyces silverae]|uniref:Uncharacterized protein n=1 Tax=Blastomyces silverae TaxID=2060906 RepID=A0A0H1BES6_9EURO|nr:hypothetical protein EMPG_14615 [Blastomyces silverae]